MPTRELAVAVLRRALRALRARLRSGRPSCRRPPGKGADDDQRRRAAAVDGRSSPRGAGRRVPRSRPHVADPRTAAGRRRRRVRRPARPVRGASGLAPRGVDARSADERGRPQCRARRRARGGRTRDGQTDSPLRDRQQRGAQPPHRRVLLRGRVEPLGTGGFGAPLRRRLLRGARRLLGRDAHRRAPRVRRQSHRRDDRRRRGDVDVVRVARPVRASRPPPARARDRAHRSRRRRYRLGRRMGRAARRRGVERGDRPHALGDVAVPAARGPDPRHGIDGCARPSGNPGRAARVAVDGTRRAGHLDGPCTHAVARR